MLPITEVLNKYHGPHEDSVYCGRGSPLGNPFPIDDKNGHTREVVIRKCAEAADLNPNLMELYRSMKGKRMVCFCAPKACHLDVIAFVAEGIETTASAAADRLLLKGQTFAQYCVDLLENSEDNAPT